MANFIKHLPRSIAKLHKDIVVSHGKGSWLCSSTGKRYLDFTSGIGVLATGHCHPRIVEASRHQSKELVHAPQLTFGSHEPQIELLNKMQTTLPNGLDTIFFTNSGSESTDNAILISRQYTQKPNVISIMGGFHGRTIGARSLNSSGLNSRKKSQPLMPGVFFTEPTKESLDKVLSLQTSPDETACIIMESVQGEYGIHSLDSEFMQYTRQVCDDEGIIMICDEVQCGAGRTGTWWNFEQKGVVPDMITFGKGIASGYPMAGVVSTDEIMYCGEDCLGGTYNGNALSSRISTETINIIQDENLLDNSRYMGNLIYEGIKDIDICKEVRQYGLMIGITPKHLTAMEIVQKLREKNILTLLAGNRKQYVRLLPPLNVKKNECMMFVDIMQEISRSI